MCPLTFKKRLIVTHSELMVKVKQLATENILSNRRQIVVINGTPSGSAPVTIDVSQSSVLEPVSFITDINNMDIGLNNSFKV